MPNSSFMQSSPNRPSTSSGLQGMPFMPRMFIGAVEDEWQMYSDRPSDYTLGSPIGFGASSIVYTALFHPPPEPNQPSAQPIPCAVKVLNLDSLAPHSLSLLQRETTLMSLSKHPNVIRVRGSWIDGHKLYIAMRLMNKGSAADIMRYGWPGGMEEDVCRCILSQALQGLNYLHINGFIHRDVKAANLLIDDDGTVLLGDLGVAADLTEDSSFAPQSSAPSHSRSRTITTASAALAAGPVRASTPDSNKDYPHASAGGSKRVVLVDTPIPTRPKIGKRKSFVGTPCWMAPELIQGRQYDSSADIWSFGITALELTQGRPPRAREASHKVLLKIIQEDPPTLIREGGTYKYSRAFKEVVDSCLVKDPTKRPTAQQLLQTPFFKAAKKPYYLVNAILRDLPPLTQRQERRAIPTAHSHHSVDSWDFSTTVHSHSPSVYRRRNHDNLDPDNTIQHDDAFDFHGSQSSLPGRRHFRGVPWVEDPQVVEEVEEDAEPPPSSAALSPSESGFTARSLGSSPSSSASAATSTAPSSVIASGSASQSLPHSPALEAPVRHTKVKKHKSPPRPSTSPGFVSPRARPLFAPSRVQEAPEPASHSHQPSAPAPAPRPQSPGLWRRIRSVTNLKRTSRGGQPEGQGLGSPEENGKQDRTANGEQERKGGVGSRFVRRASSAGRQALAGATARTAQAVGWLPRS